MGMSFSPVQRKRFFQFFAGVVIASAVGVAIYAFAPERANQLIEGEVATSTQQNGESPVNPPAQGSPPAAAKKPVRLIYPNGGQVWYRGKQYNIQWRSDLPGTIGVRAVLFKPTTLVTDPYAVRPRSIGGYEMFSRSTFTTGGNEGSFSYRVPDGLPPGKYQVLLWAGDNCSEARPEKRCQFDLSDSFFTIR